MRGCAPGAYDVNWSTQDRRVKGAVRIGRTAIVSPDQSYHFRRPVGTAPRPSGTLGDTHPDPARRHCPAPIPIAKQTTRRQKERAGFTDKDPRQEAWNKEHGPLNVKYHIVEHRAGRFVPFGRQTTYRSPDGPFSEQMSMSGDCFTDLGYLEDGD